MEKTMRFLSCLLIMAMLVTMMAVPAYAATPDGSITLQAPGDEVLTGKTFEIYRLFGATMSGEQNDSVAYQWIPNGTNNPYFYDFFFGTGGPLEDGNGTIEEVTNYIKTSSDSNKTWLQGFASDLAKYIKGIEYPDGEEGEYNNAFAAVKHTLTAGTGDVTEVTQTGLEYGYYLVYEVFEGSSDSQVRSAILLTTVEKDAKATLKIVRPTIRKQAQRDIYTYEGLSASVGESLNFFIEVIVPDFQYYDAPTFIIDDDPAEGFTMPTDAVDYTVEVEGVKVDESNYYFDPVAYSFTFVPSYIKSIPGKRLSIKYSAVMNEKASVGGYKAAGVDPEEVDDSDKNTVKLTYSADPYSSDTNIVTDIVRVYSFRLDVFKQAHVGETKLDGAQFVLKNNKNQYAKTIDENSIMIKQWVDSKDEATVFETANGGKMSVEGLGRGTFTLIETLPPDGYQNPNVDFTFEIGGATDPTSGVLTALNVSNFSDSLMHSGSGNVETGTVSFTINNNAGFELPETGGMGTTLFTIGGLILMAGAAALLIARKKTEN